MRTFVPKKISESWFTVQFEGKTVGHDRFFWEPHGDRTAWFERHAKFTAGKTVIDRKVEARFKIGEWPDLQWLRFRDNVTGASVEVVTEGTGAAAKPGVRVIPPAGDLCPSYLVDIVAASSPTTPGPVTKISLLNESEARVIGGFTLVCKGPEEIEINGERFKTTRYALEQMDGKSGYGAGCWVDENRKVRKIDLNGPIAYLSTKAAALGESV